MGQRTCGYCGCDISDRHARARYCGPKCRKDAEVAKRDPDERRAKDQARRAERLTQLGPRACVSCGSPIGHRPPHARYCGKPCKKRAELKRDRALRAERTRVWSAAHPDYIKLWAAENTDLKRAALRRSYRRHREVRRADNRAWEARNPGSARLRATKRRLLKLGNSTGLTVTSRDFRRLISRHGGHCAYCGVKPEKLHLDHVVPIARGGRHSIGNLLPACESCNLSKHATFLSVWRHRREGASNGRTRHGTEGNAFASTGLQSARVRDAAGRGRRRTARTAAA